MRITTHSVARAANEPAAWMVCGLSSIAAIALLVKFDIGVEPESFAGAVLLMAFLSGAYVVYRRWRPDPVLSNLCGALAVIAWSGAMAGIISLVGLRYGAQLIDGHLASIDLALGMDTRSFVEAVSRSPFWSSLLGLAYQSSFVLLAALTVFLALTRRFERVWELALVFAATVVLCTVVSVFLPARGAFAYFDYASNVLDGLPTGAGLYHLPKFDYYRNDPAPIIAFSTLQGVVTFPSFHCCLALATIFACRGIRWLFSISLIWNTLVIVSTIPVGGHYVIDLPSGAILWLASTMAAWALTRRQASRPKFSAATAT